MVTRHQFPLFSIMTSSKHVRVRGVEKWSEWKKRNDKNLRVPKRNETICWARMSFEVRQSEQGFFAICHSGLRLIAEKRLTLCNKGQQIHLIEDAWRMDCHHFSVENSISTFTEYWWNPLIILWGLYLEYVYHEYISLLTHSCDI